MFQSNSYNSIVVAYISERNSSSDLPLDTYRISKKTHCQHRTQHLVGRISELCCQVVYENIVYLVFTVYDTLLQLQFLLCVIWVLFQKKVI